MKNENKKVTTIWTLSNGKEIKVTNWHNEDILRDRLKKMGITIIDVKIIGVCSKHRNKGDEVPKDNAGREYRDDEIECIECGFSDKRIKNDT